VQGVTNTESIHRTVIKEADKIYPPIYYRTEVYERGGKQCVRVDIKHNGQAPHFGGPAWVRQGSRTIIATEQLYQQMIDQRQSKVRVLLQWLNKEVTVEGTYRPKPRTVEEVMALGPYKGEWSVGVHQATLTVVNAHWVTFDVAISQDLLQRVAQSEPIEKLMLSWDNQRQRLTVIVKNAP